MTRAPGELAPFLRTVTKTAILALLVLFVFLFPVNRPEDPDVWFHLAAGRHIWQQGELPTMDTFLHSYPADGPTNHHEWLFQALIYPLYRLTGMEGLVLAKAAAIGLSFLLLFFSSPGRRPSCGAVLVLLAAYGAGSGRFYIRPEIAGALIFALQWRIMSRRLDGRGAAALLALQILWTNLHWSSILGVALATAFAAAGAAGHLVRLPRGWTTLPPGRTPRGQVLLLVGIILATFVSPDGLEPFIEPFRYLDSSGFALPVAEVWPMHWVFYRDSGGITFHHWFFGTAVVVTLLFLANVKKINLAHLFTFAGLTVLTLAAERHVLFFALLAVPIALENLPLPERKTGAFRAGEALGALVLLFLLTALTMNRITGVQFLIPYPRPYEPISLGVSPVLWPERGARLLGEKNLPGEIFNDFNSGNFLNWAIYPRKIYINGTFSDPGTVEEYARLGAFPDEWESFVKDRDIETAFFRISPIISSPDLLRHLLGHRGWKLVFFDGVGAVFVRDAPSNRPLTEELAVDLAGELQEAIDSIPLEEQVPGAGRLPILEDIARFQRQKDLARLFRLRGQFYLLAGREDLAAVAADILAVIEG